MTRRASLLALGATLLAGGVASLVIRASGPAPVTRAPSPPIEDALPPEETPPAPPVAEAPAELVRRLIGALRAVGEDDVAGREALVAGAFDGPRFAEAAFESRWRQLSTGERLVAARDLRAPLAAEGARAAPSWLRKDPRVVGVEASGGATRVRTLARDDAEVVFVFAPDADGSALVDLVVEGVSIVSLHRQMLARLPEREAGSPIARIAAKLVRVRSAAP